MFLGSKTHISVTVTALATEDRDAWASMHGAHLTLTVELCLNLYMIHKSQSLTSSQMANAEIMQQSDDA